MLFTPPRPPDQAALYPLGFHKLELTELEVRCVDAFPLSTTRKILMDNFRKFVSHLESLGVHGELWVDGSFTTEKIDPSDIDIILRYRGEDYDDLNNTQYREAVDWVNANQKKALKCDSYTVYEYQQGHALHEEGDWWYSYWKVKWGFSREEDPKGIVVIGRTKLEEAMGLTLQLLSSRGTNEIEAMTEKVGLPAVRQAYYWACENSKYGFGADILWVNSGIKAYLQPAEVSELVFQISSSMAKEKRTVTGTLNKVVMFDRTFEMEVEGKVIAGTFDKAISDANPAEVPGRYTAIIESSTKIAGEEGKEETSFFLLSLSSRIPLTFEELDL